jgi:hypothetical protein
VVNHWVNSIEDLLTGKVLEAEHATHLRFYSDKSLDVDEVLLDSLRVQANFEIFIESIVGRKYNERELLYYLCVHWQGFESLEDTWEPLENLVYDNPAVVEAYILSLPATDPARPALLEAFRALRG